MKFSYDWLQTYFDETLPEASEIERVVGLQAFEPEGMETVDDDIVLDFDVLPNRAHDCLCHRGLAKEIGLLCNRELTIPTPDPAITNQDIVLAAIDAPERCRRYSARVINGVKVGPSPDWLKRRLEAIGQRSINNVVDATNYVMFDLGQPLHAFDADKVSGTITARLAQEGETINLLGGEERTLSMEHLVIADDEGALAVAGVKGGTKAEVGLETTRIILEAANFEPVSTRQTSRALKLQTDSSKRFENEITSTWTVPALDAVAALILDIASGDNTTVGPITDVYPAGEPDLTQIVVSVSQINNTLGLALSKPEIGALCNRLDFHVTSDGEVFTLGIRPERLDLTIAEDIIEEIGRVYGYDNIPATLPTTPATVTHPATLLQHRIRNWLLERSWNEVMTYTFRDAGDVEMANALASDKNFLRTNLADGFRESLEKNVKNAELFGGEAVAQFEIGSVFPGNAQETHLCLGYASNKKKDSRDLAKILSDMNTDLGLDLAGTETGGVLEVALPNNPEVAGDYASAGIINSGDQRRFEAPSIYPFMTRDVAVWLPEDANPTQLVDIFVQHTGDLLARPPRLFDQFSKDGRTSYAYRIVLQSNERTLTDDEVGEIMQKISREIESRGWEER